MSNMHVTGKFGSNDKPQLQSKAKLQETDEVSAWTDNQNSENLDLLNKDSFESTVDNETGSKQGYFERRKTAYEKTLLKSGTITKHMGMSVSGELLELSLMSEEERTKAVEADGGEVLNCEQSREKLETLNMHEGDSNHTSSENMKLKTMVFGLNSKVTKTVNNNETLQKLVKDWVTNGENDGEIISFNTADSESFDLRMGLGYSKVVGLQRTSEDYVEGYVEDVYDFDKVYNKGQHEEDNFLKRIKSSVVQSINNIAYDLQNKGEIQPYRCLIPIKVKLQ